MWKCEIFSLLIFFVQKKLKGAGVNFSALLKTNHVFTLWERLFVSSSQISVNLKILFSASVTSYSHSHWCTFIRITASTLNQSFCTIVPITMKITKTSFLFLLFQKHLLWHSLYHHQFLGMIILHLLLGCFEQYQWYVSPAGILEM